MPTENFRVLHVIARFNIGGTARYLSNLLPELKTNNLETLLAVGRIQAGEVEDSSLSKLHHERVESLGRRISLSDDVKAYFKLRRVVGQYRPDVIHTHTFKAGLLGRLMYFNIPKVHTYHGHLLTDPEFSKSQIKVILKIEKSLAIFTKKLIVTGQQIALDLLNKGVGRSSQYLSIPGESRLTNVVSRQIARRRLGLSDEFTILWSARVAAVKNPKLLVEVARLLPKCEFLMAGDGLELDSIKLSAPSNLKILGFIDIGDILMAGDVFLSTSLNEGIPYSILEAQSVGLPTVAVNAGALAEIIFDGVNGFLVKPDAKEIVNKLMELMASSEKLRSMSLEAKRSVFREQPHKSFAAEHIEVYRTILEES
jgi:glycosyltransferase involved in cell wall biosynthesis